MDDNIASRFHAQKDCGVSLMYGSGITRTPHCLESARLVRGNLAGSSFWRRGREGEAPFIDNVTWLYTILQSTFVAATLAIALYPPTTTHKRSILATSNGNTALVPLA